MMRARENQPNILLIVLDTLRADRLSCYGHPATTTPHLDVFAEQSVLFERAISPAQWTIPAHGSLFTGEFPSTHGTTQIYDRHAVEHPTLAERLTEAGYATVGFCNNPLLGVVENDLDRGFEAFYNYGGILPARPKLLRRHERVNDWLETAIAWLREQVRSLNGPIQATFTRNDFLLGLAMHPWLAPLWERNINFKGNTTRSIADFVGYLRAYHEQEDAPPLFAYLNLMETHLPYNPPAQFSREFAPSYHQERGARDFMRAFNYQTYDWLTPVTEPFSDLQHHVLNEMYNAEVAYEDHLLHSLFAWLDEPDVRDQTLVIITSDHGEGLDHHGYVGHSLVTYEDLVRVPLLLRYPPHYEGGVRVAAPTSTRRIFHTIMQVATESAGGVIQDDEKEEGAALSLRRVLQNDPSVESAEDIVWSEAFPPITLLKLMEGRDVEAIDAFQCRAVRRAIYDVDASYKLVTVNDTPTELFDVTADPAELDNRIAAHPDVTSRLDRALKGVLAEAESRRLQRASGAGVDLESNRRVRERLRRLGYLE